MGVSYQIVSATVVPADITCITAGSAAVNRSLYTADQRTFEHSRPSPAARGRAI